MSREGLWLICALIICLFTCRAVNAGFYLSTVSPGNVPWLGGVVPYVIDPALSAAQRQTYLNGLREWELAANVQFIPRTTQTQYILFKYDPAGPNSVSGSNPQIVAINALTRGQICHEMGHSFGLLHEHARGDQATYVKVLTANITSGNQSWFDIDPNGTAQGPYDFESVMHSSRDRFSIQPGVLDTLEAKSPFERFQPRMGGFALSKGDRAVMKFLYGAGPTLSPVVTNTSESGVGGLRAALHFATDNPGTTITFNVPTTDPGYANGVFTIRLTGHVLPVVVDGTMIDGTTQPGYAGSPLIVLDGSQILPEAGSVPGMFVYAANSTVKGLSFQRFPWVGLALLYPDAHNNTIRGCRFGLDYSGASAPNYQGVYISNGANSNTIGGTTTADHNVLSGNNQYGIWISGANTTANVVLGNYIGTKADGLTAMPNGFGGLIVTDSSHDNLIGGTSSGARNIISGNEDAGVWLTGAGVNQNTVRGNYIGLGASGAALPNTFAGLYILNGAQNNLVADNVISGNASEGLRLENAGTTGNVVQGNRVGTAPDGGSAIGNGFVGVTIYGGAQSNTIGGTTAGALNLISGNAGYGLVISDPGSNANLVQGNFIGVNSAGNAALPNAYAGVGLSAGAQSNTIGGTTPGARNIISGNSGDGIAIFDPGTALNVIQGNYIGLDLTGIVKIANAFSGVDIFGGAHDNTIGGTTPGARNFISGSGSYGVAVRGIGTNSNLIQGNTIGLNVANATIANAFQGVALFQASPADPSGPQFNLIGGNAVGASNIIAGNTNEGVALFDAGTIKNTISQNSIFSNGGGISLNTGSNNSQVPPTLNSAALSTATNPNGTDVSVSMTGSTSTTFRIEFFASPSGGNQGKFFVGSTSVNGGTTNLIVPLTAVVPAGFGVTATATAPNGNTSAFSPVVTVPSPSDTDGDGMPNNYENAHTLNPSVNDANVDSDGDGMTNIQEYKAGTDPKDPKSRFMISSIDRSAGNPRISFQALGGKTYRLDYRDDLTTGNWNTLVDQIFSPTTTPPLSPLQIVDPSGAGLSKRFYRLSSEP